MIGIIISSVFLLILQVQSQSVVSPTTLESARLKGLTKHNELRAKHGTPALVLDATLNSKAQAYAKNLADNSLFQHSNDALTGQLGENLYYTCQYPSVPDVPTATVLASQAWYDEIKDYNFATPGFTSKTGHFTALVWKSTTKVGFGVALGTRVSGSTTFNCVYVCANYLTPGNVNTAQQFAANVPRLISA